MTPQEIEDLVNGPEPDRTECREVPFADLGSDECDHEVSFGTGGPPLHCGAPRVEGYVVCRMHLFDAANEGYDPGELSTKTRKK